MDRRVLMLRTQYGLIATALIMGGIVVAGLLQVWHIFVFTLITGVAWTFSEPVRQSLIPSVVPKQDLANAIALNSGGFNDRLVWGRGKLFCAERGVCGSVGDDLFNARTSDTR
jgi:hypothetical protein